MPHRQQLRVDRDLAALRERTLRMAALCEAILAKSLQALWDRDAGLASEVKRDDLDIDRLDVDIDDAVLRILALTAPVAADLRMVVAIKSIATNLERVGDLARNIATSAVRIASHESFVIPDELHVLADQSRRVLSHANHAFAELDAELARRVLEEDDPIDALEDRLVRESIARLTAVPETTEPELDLIFVARDLERVADQATNIAEEVVLAAEAKILKHASKLGTA
ncbi:MAG: phosphate signaling complex protein PhoU [Spirochaetaceae bacterium]|nr:phosphate signaling complex protein PhoU [Spirochaetaceae bacterium]HPG24359.1 phosphate signaling complex protein PhoU [Myxococcota bacterium]